MPTDESVREKSSDGIPSDSIPLAVGVLWILPMLIIAALTRFAIDNGPSFLPQQSRPISVAFDQAAPNTGSIHRTVPQPSPRPTPAPSKEPTIDLSTPFLSNKPVSYQEVVKSISRRRLDWTTTSSVPDNKYDSRSKYEKKAEQKQSQQPEATKPRDQPSRGASTDPNRLALLREIEQLRADFQSNPSNLYNVLRLADSLRTYDVQFHDGGTMQEEAIAVHQHALKIAWEKRNAALEAGEETNRALTGVVDINEEIMLDYSARSIDGILCAVYTSLGKTLFMANMFEKAVESYTEAIKIEPTYLDAIAARGSSLIILGRYEEAARDFNNVIEKDTKRRFLDAFTGLARVLQAKESASPEGWEPMIRTLQDLIQLLESQVNQIQQPEGRALVGSSLARMYHVLFNYHDTKTMNIEAAWESLTRAYKFKMDSLPPWNHGFETQKVQSTKQIFHAGFWPDVGSDSEIPIFIIGFVRSGSTLLERILDAHPEIAGLGENSVFNGQLDQIRNQIVETSMLGDPKALRDEIQRLADGVVNEMKSRWDLIASAEDRAADRPTPRKYVDKMLTNYYNVGFIHMLFPKALILHVAREPMDTIFSAYKHEFPSGTLDYTSSMDSLAELYHGYRDIMDHWDATLPGRVTHIKYEDMVRDTPGVTRAIIDATGLDWHDDILNFHKKKQAVNTLSTTQVRKGIYTDSLQAWRKYEVYLQPLLKLIGNRVHYDLKTTLSNYKPKSADNDSLNDEL